MARAHFMKPRILSITLLALSLSSGIAQDQRTLISAVEAGNLMAAKKFVAEGANLEARNDKGWTPLIIAAAAGNTQIATLLLDRGADANARSTSETGSTALCFATQMGDTNFIDLFLQYGARINDRGGNGLTALGVAVIQKKMVEAKFLISRGAKVDALGYLDKEGRLWTPLMQAVGQANIPFIELLLGSGASLEKRNNRGETVLMHAARYPRPEILTLLLKRGANVNAKTPEGHTALILAADGGSAENVKVLLAAGADPHAKWGGADDTGEHGHDATFYAKIYHFDEVVKLIQAAQEESKPKGAQP